jgi:hypothetical protein
MSSQATSLRPKFCPDCGQAISALAPVCPNCGLTQPALPGRSDKHILPAALLCFLLGWCGAHRFYVGKPGTAVLQLLTIGGLGIWALVDLVLLVTESFTDGRGNKITEWT